MIKSITRKENKVLFLVILLYIYKIIIKSLYNYKNKKMKEKKR